MTALALFIDNPEHASPEPALAAAISSDQVPKAYEGMLDRLRNLTALFAGEKYLFYSHYPNWNDAWDINMYRKRIQSGESIPNRINAALTDLSEESPDSILWLGIGAVAADASDLERVATELQNADLVIGESGTGSILMLGFAQKAFTLGIPETFVAAEVVAAAESSGLKVARVNLPASPTSPEELAQLGITID